MGLKGLMIMGVTEKGRPSLALGISEFRRSKLFLDQLNASN